MTCTSRYSPASKYVAPVDCTEASAEETCLHDNPTHFTNVTDNPPFGILLWAIANANGQFDSTWVNGYTPANLEFQTSGSVAVTGVPFIPTVDWDIAEPCPNLTLTPVYDHSRLLRDSSFVSMEVAFSAEFFDGIEDGQMTWRELPYQSVTSIRNTPSKARVYPKVFYNTTDQPKQNPNCCFLFYSTQKYECGFKHVPIGFSAHTEPIAGVITTVSDFRISRTSWDAYSTVAVNQQHLAQIESWQNNMPFGIYANREIHHLDFLTFAVLQGGYPPIHWNYFNGVPDGSSLEYWLNVPTGTVEDPVILKGFDIGHYPFDYGETNFGTTTDAGSYNQSMNVELNNISTDWGCWSKVNCIEGKVVFPSGGEIDTCFGQYDDYVHFYVTNEILSVADVSNYVVKPTSIETGSGSYSIVVEPPSALRFYSTDPYHDWITGDYIVNSPFMDTWQAWSDKHFSVTMDTDLHALQIASNMTPYMRIIPDWTFVPTDMTATVKYKIQAWVPESYSGAIGIPL